MEQEFTISTGMKIFYSLIAAFLAGFALFLFNLDHSKAGPAVLLIPAFLIVFAIFIFVKAVKSKIIISADYIIRINTFGEKRLLTNNVKGYRIGEKTIVVEPESALDAKITINNSNDYGSVEDLKSWLAENFTELDALDLKQEQDQILHDSNLGITEQEREGKLSKAQLMARIYNVAGVAIAIGSFLIDNYFVTIILLLYPLTGIALMWFSEGLIKFMSNKKRSPYPFIVIGFYLPVLILLIKSVLKFDIFNCYVPLISLSQ